MKGDKVWGCVGHIKISDKMKPDRRFHTTSTNIKASVIKRNVRLSDKTERHSTNTQRISTLDDNFKS